MKPSRVCGTSPDLGCSDVSGSMCRVTSPVDPSCGVGVGLSELAEDRGLADGGGVGSEVPIGLDTEVSVDDPPPEECSASALLSLSDSSTAFLKS